MASVGQPVIESTDVRKAYGPVQALDGVTLTVGSGECVALLGPNGAGKTTMTEILAGHRHADSGTVRVLGTDPATAPRHWFASIGIVLQSVQDLGDITVREAVRHFAGYYPDPRPVPDTIAAVGLDEKADARIGKLSGGQRRRLDVALGIIGRPALLFLDEPTTGFDPEARREFWTLVEELKADGTTILLTTHYLDEAERLADRVAVIARGRVLACDSPARLGGRDDGLAEVRWLRDGEPRVELTTRPTALVAELAASLGGEVPGLTVRRQSLEDAYLDLIAASEGQER